MTKGNIILKKIRTDRNLSLSAFSCLIGISTSYLCVLEKGTRVLSQKLVNKVTKNIPDISSNEKIEIKITVEKDLFLNTKEIQKHITKLITEFFYRRKNDLGGLDTIADEIEVILNNATKQHTPK